MDLVVATKLMYTFLNFIGACGTTSEVCHNLQNVLHFTSGCGTTSIGSYVYVAIPSLVCY